MTPAEFKKKWAKYTWKESSAYQEHFNDLCRLLQEPTPAEADSSGSDFFCFQKRAVKDAELFDLDAPDSSDPHERGFADVWKKGCFAWEYKGKKKNLEEAYKQLLRYRESLLNPPLLVVCDFDRYVIRTNFNGTVQETHEFTNDQIDRPENFRTLRALFGEPDFLKPQRTTAQVTEKLAATIAEVAKSLQKRESVELADAKTRAEVNFAQRRNLRIARFLNRIVFCFFAEDSGLLPKNLFSDIAKTALADPKHFAATLEELFRVMADGGNFGQHKIRHFNGHLFEEATVFELNDHELGKLIEAASADWQYIEPSIMGTLFERALEPGQRSQLGARYTSEADKHRLFVWLDSVVLPDSKVIAIASDDDYRFGVLQSRAHEVWTLAMCGWHGKGNDATYNPTECFETFPFPCGHDVSPPKSPAPKTMTPESGWDGVMATRFHTLREEPPASGGGGASRKLTDAQHRAAVAAAAEELNELREHWLHPLEWTVPGVLEFSGSTDGPWARYLHLPNKDGIGTVRYPRLEPRDAASAAKLKKRTLTNLYNERPAWLDLAHQKLDAAVAAAYGWPADLSDEQILEKLLALNLERAAQETKAAKVKKPKAARERHADEMI